MFSTDDSVGCGLVQRIKRCYDTDSDTSRKPICLRSRLLVSPVHKLTLGGVTDRAKCGLAVRHLTQLTTLLIQIFVALQHSAHLRILIIQYLNTSHIMLTEKQHYGKGKGNVDIFI